jgi:hypothetical protein
VLLCNDWVVITALEISGIVETVGIVGIEEGITEVLAAGI